MVAEQTVADRAEAEEHEEEQTRSRTGYQTPPVDIFEDDNGLVVIADLPGVNRDDLNVSVNRGVLTIEARAKHLASTEPTYREYELTGFFREFRLPQAMDTSQVSAELASGVLTIRIPRSEQAKPHVVEVNT